MRIHYINLDGALERRAALEANVAAVAPGAELVRFPAVTAEEAAGTPGPLTPNEKGCFRSHRELLASRDPGETILVLEDDARVSRLALPALNTTLAATGDAWDVIFTDVAIGDCDLMAELIRRRRKARAGQFGLLDLRPLHFSGTTAYAVRGGFREELNRLLARYAELNTPYDLAMRALIQEGAVRGACLFPFVTTLADIAVDSQVQTSAKAVKDLPLNLFRRLMWVDRDVEECLALAKALDALMCDDEARIGGAVFAALSSSAFDGQL